MECSFARTVLATGRPVRLCVRPPVPRPPLPRYLRRMDIHNLGGGFNGVACPLNRSQESVLGQPDSGSIAVGDPRPFVFDERLLRRRA